jgi:predicted branched-subunit amino acid permease
MNEKKKNFVDGLRDGFPIGMGYFAVAFSLGFIARKAGLTPLEGYLASVLNHASAGEYGLYTSIAELATYAEVALITFIANARYLLMSCSLSQRFDPNAPFFHRLLVGFGITDEIFGVSIARPGYLSPEHFYGAMVISIPLWGLGNFLGIWLGNLLPGHITSALSVALYGMFIAIIIPPSKRDNAVGISVIASFLLSWLCSVLPTVREMSAGTRTIVLTILIAAMAAYVKPVKIEDHDEA